MVLELSGIIRVAMATMLLVRLHYLKILLDFLILHMELLRCIRTLPELITLRME